MCLVVASLAGEGAVIASESAPAEPVETAAAAAPASAEEPAPAAAAPAPAEGPAPQTAAPPSKPAEDGLFPKAFRIPGTDVYVTFGGYAKVDFIQDFDAIGEADEFKVNSIPAEGTPAADQSGRTTIHARETRFNVDFGSNTPHGKFHAFFEGDFFGQNNDFRMRHAYGEFGRVLGGQTWTTFMDISARPLTIDYEGPDAEVFVRQAMIRYTHPLTDRWTWRIAVEDPSPQFVVPAGLFGTPTNDAPDVPTTFRYEAERWHVQMGAIVRQIRFDGEQGSPDLTATGWGGNFTFRVKVFGGDAVMGQVAHGEGIARYIESFNGQNVDAIVTPSIELEPLPASAAVLGYIHQWSEELKSGIALAASDLDPDESQPGTTIESTRDGRVNLVWTPFRLVDYAVEALWGKRTNFDGTDGDAWRLQFALTYRFN